MTYWKTTRKAKVTCCHTKQDRSSPDEETFDPPLYLIFDDGENSAKGKEKFMNEIIDLATKTNIPCHIVKQKFWIHSGKEKQVCNYANEKVDTLQKLVEKGFHEVKKEEEETVDDIHYFINKATSSKATKEDVYPVFICLQNGEMTTKTEKLKDMSETYKMPIICFKNKTKDVSVVWFTKKNPIKYKTDTSKPWQITTTIFEEDKSSDKIEYISEIRSDIVSLICKLIVSVCLEEASSTEGQYVTYCTALLKCLIRNGEMTIYKERYLEYIQEKVKSNKSSISEMVDRIAVHEGSGRDYESYGLLFVALLYNKCVTQALQLFEEGHIGIHHMLVGTVLLQNELNSWKTTTLVKEKLQHLEKTFTERAIHITSYIYETDKQNRNDKKKNEDHDDNNHAERLLLNHGYLRAAIYTENTTYLESDTVKKILAKSFYGTEFVHGQTTLCIILLVAVHLLVLPLLAFNMEARPLRWFYLKYRLHFMKVYIHMLGLSVLLFAYAYMLLFDYRADGITFTDYVILVWMTSFFVDETKQVIVAVIRCQLKKYSTDWWNLLDWVMIIVYASGMILKIVEGSVFRIISKMLLVTAFMALCTRLLHLSFMTEFLERKLVINRKMIKDSIAFLIIITIVMVWYSVSFYALMYPNSEFSWIQMEKILRNGYWMLYGDLNLDEPDCTFNRTMYENGVLQRCPTELGLYVTPYLTAFYGLIAVVLLLNLLIAMYSDTYTKVQENANFYWLQMQTDLFEEYSIKTVFPIHLQLLTLPGTLLAIIGFGYVYLKKRLMKLSPDCSQHPFPMIVRVFLYNSNYDLRLSETIKAEEDGVQKAREKVYFVDSDHKKTMTKLEEMEQSYKDIPEKLMERLQNMEQMLKEITNKLDLDKRSRGMQKAVGIANKDNSTTKL